jgi:hypothetical protein
MNCMLMESVNSYSKFPTSIDWKGTIFSHDKLEGRKGLHVQFFIYIMTISFIDGESLSICDK